jgi:hypothetical protein
MTVYKVIIPILKSNLVFSKPDWLLVLEGDNRELNLSLNEDSDIEASMVYYSSKSDNDSNQPSDKGKGKEIEDTDMDDDSGSDVSSDEELEDDVAELLNKLYKDVQTYEIKRQIKALENLLGGVIEKDVPRPPKPPVPDYWGHGWYGPPTTPKDKIPVTENTSSGSGLVPIPGDIGTSSSSENTNQRPPNTGNNVETGQLPNNQGNIEETGQSTGNSGNTEETGKRPKNTGNTGEVSNSNSSENPNEVSGNNTRNTNEVSNSNDNITNEVWTNTVENTTEPSTSVQPDATPKQSPIDFVCEIMATEFPSYIWDDWLTYTDYIIACIL